MDCATCMKELRLITTDLVQLKQERPHPGLDTQVKYWEQKRMRKLCQYLRVPYPLNPGRYSYMDLEAALNRVRLAEDTVVFWLDGSLEADSEDPVEDGVVVPEEQKRIMSSIHSFLTEIRYKLEDARDNAYRERIAYEATQNFKKTMKELNK